MDMISPETTDNLLAVSVTLLTAYVLKQVLVPGGKKYKLPPGPRRLPFVGTLMSHGVSPDEFTKLSAKYGDVITCYVGSQRCVVLNSYDTIREALVDKGTDFAHRGSGWLGKQTNPQQHGIIQADYTCSMHRLRSDSVAILRTLGFGKSVMEEKIAFEAAELVRVIAEQKGQPFDPAPSVSVHVFNVIHAVLFDKRFDHKDKAVNDVIKVTNDWMATGIKAYVIEIFPFMRFINRFKQAMNKYKQCQNSMLDYLNKYIDCHVKEHTAGMDHDYLHAMLDKRSLGIDDSESSISRSNLGFVLRDFIVAGAETTANSLRWTILLMVNHPNVQKKAHDEIDRVLGRERDVTLKDREQLPFIEALIWEVQRFKTIAQLAVPKHTLADTNVRGYDVPANTRVFQNIKHVHMDPKTWGGGGTVVYVCGGPWRQRCVVG